MRLSPLNILLACVLVWAISDFGSEGEPLFSWGWLILYSIAIIAADIISRLWVSDTKRLWGLQVVFIIVVALGAILIKLI